jgi:hypothetical protein
MCDLSKSPNFSRSHFEAGLCKVASPGELNDNPHLPMASLDWRSLPSCSEAQLVSRSCFSSILAALLYFLGFASSVFESASISFAEEVCSLLDFC